MYVIAFPTRVARVGVASCALEALRLLCISSLSPLPDLAVAALAPHPRPCWLLFARAAEEPGASPGPWNDCRTWSGILEAAGDAGHFPALLQQRINPSCFPVHRILLCKTETVILFLPL